MRAKSLVQMWGAGRVLDRIFPQNEKQDPRATGGTNRLEAERPIRRRGLAKVARWVTYWALFPATLVFLNFNFQTAGFLEMLLVITMFMFARFVLRQNWENASGLLGFVWEQLVRSQDLTGQLVRNHDVRKIWLGDVRFGIAFAVVFSITTISRLIVALLPANSGALEALDFAADWLYMVLCIAGPVLAMWIAHNFALYKKWVYSIYELMGNPGGILDSVAGFTIARPEHHGMLQIDPSFVDVFPVPAKIAAKFDSIETELTRTHTDHWMLSDTSSPQRIRLVPINAEKLRDREFSRTTGGTLRGYVPGTIEDSEILGDEFELPADAIPAEATSPPKPIAALVEEGVNESDLELIQSIFYTASPCHIVIGHDFLRWNPDNRQYENRVYLQQVSKKEAAIVRRIIKYCFNGKVGSAWPEFHWVVNDEEDSRRQPMRIETLVLKRSTITGSESKILEKLEMIIALLPKGNNGWKIEFVPESDVVILRYGKPLQLPFPVLGMFKEQVDPATWWLLEYGISTSGLTCSIDLKSGPHTVVVGATGSGKTIFLTQIAISALGSGFQLVLIDPVKSGLDFLELEPFCKGFATSYEAADKMVRHIYKEVDRRKAVLLKYKKRNWYSLPADVREREDMNPLLVIIDEYMSISIQTKAPGGLAKDDPLVEKADALNAAKGGINLNVGNIAREARYIGIHLALAMQRPDVAAIPGFGEVRSNITTRIQLFAPASIPATQTLGMLFDNAAVADVHELARQLTDGKTPGLAISMEDGGTPVAVRVGYADTEEVDEHGESVVAVKLRAMGVKADVKWDFDPQNLQMVSAAENDDRLVPSTPLNDAQRDIAAADWPLAPEFTDPAPVEVNKSVKELFGFNLGE